MIDLVKGILYNPILMKTPYIYCIFSVSPTSRVIQLVRSMKTNQIPSPRDLKGIIGSQKYFLDQKSPQNLQKEKSHELLKVFQNPNHHQTLLASRQMQEKHIAQKLRPSQEKREVTRERYYILANK